MFVRLMHLRSEDDIIGPKKNEEPKKGVKSKKEYTLLEHFCMKTK